MAKIYFNSGIFITFTFMPDEVITLSHHSFLTIFYLYSINLAFSFTQQLNRNLLNNNGLLHCCPYQIDQLARIYSN